jgi:hypothetical protein
MAGFRNRSKQTSTVDGGITPVVGTNVREGGGKPPAAEASRRTRWRDSAGSRSKCPHWRRDSARGRSNCPQPVAGCRRGPKQMSALGRGMPPVAGATVRSRWRDAAGGWCNCPRPVAACSHRPKQLSALSGGMPPAAEAKVRGRRHKRAGGRCKGRGAGCRDARPCALPPNRAHSVAVYLDPSPSARASMSGAGSSGAGA